MTRAPLISRISDNITDRRKDTILSAYAVGKLFTGVTLTSLNFNTYVTPGVVRVDSSTTNGPDIINTKGFLHVFTMNSDEDDSADKDKYIIRQVLYCDDSDSGIHTRVGLGNNIASPPSSIDWSDWTGMGGEGGGGFMRRIKLLRSMEEGEEAQPNVMYYSYGNFTLNLPDPSELKLGVRIGLEQMFNPKVGGVVGTGAIKYEGLEQKTSADYKVIVDQNGDMVTTDEVVGSLIYVMTVTDVDDEHTWVLEVNSSILEMVSYVNNRVTDHMEDTEDPHPQYLKRDDLVNDIKNGETDKAVTPKAVQDAITGLGGDIGSGYVTKLELYNDPNTGNPIIKEERLTKTSDVKYGIVRMATAADLINYPPDVDKVAVNPSQIGNRRLIHKGSFKSDTTITITENDLKAANILIAVTGGSTRTISLPKPNQDMVERTANVYIDLVRTTAATTAKITCSDLSLEETFTNTENNTTIQLVFEASYTTSGSQNFTWKLVL